MIKLIEITQLAIMGLVLLGAGVLAYEFGWKMIWKR